MQSVWVNNAADADLLSKKSRTGSEKLNSLKAAQMMLRGNSMS